MNHMVAARPSTRRLLDGVAVGLHRLVHPTHWLICAQVPGDRSLLPPPAVALPPPLSDDPPRLAPPAAHQALVAATPDPLLDEAAALRDENADLRRQLLAMRRLLRTTSELFLASQASATDELPLALDEPEEDSA